MADGKITKDDLVQADAIKVYDDLKTKAVSALEAISKAIAELQKAQSKAGISGNDLKNAQAQINLELKKGELAAQQAKKADLDLANAKKQLILNSKVQTQLLKEQTTASKQNTKATEKQSEANKGLTGTFQNLLQSMLAFIGVRMFIQFAQDTFNLVKKLDSLKFAMSTVGGSMKEIGENQEFLSRITKSYGAEIVTTTERYIKFLAAARQSNLSLQDTQNIFESMTKAAGVLGLKTDELQGVYLALEQMLSKGKVTTEELRRQLGERLPGAMGIMADALGVTIPKLDEMLKKGEVLSSDALPKFAKQVELAYGITTVETINTLAAAHVRFKNKFVDLMDSFTKSTGIVSVLSSSFDFFTNNLGFIAGLAFKASAAFIAYNAVLGVTALRTTVLTGLKALLARTTMALATAKAAEMSASMGATTATTANTTATVLSTLATNAATAGVSRLRLAWISFMLVLKANIIGLVVTALVGLVWWLSKTSESASETSRELNKVNKQFATTALKGEEANKSLEKMAERYEKLSKTLIKTNEEQAEYERILKALSTAFPEAALTVSDYNVILKLNTEILKKNLKERRELEALDAGEKLIESQKQLKKLAEEKGRIEGKWEKLSRLQYITRLRANVDETKQTERTIEGLEDVISAYTGVYNERQKLDKSRATAAAKQAEDERINLLKIQKAKDLERNIPNLEKEIDLLEEERKLYQDISDTIKDVDGNDTGVRQSDRLTQIKKEIDLREKNIKQIKREEESKKGGRVRDVKLDPNNTIYDLQLSALQKFRDAEIKIANDQTRETSDRLIALENSAKFEKSIIEQTRKAKEADILADIADAKRSKRLTSSEIINKTEILNGEISKLNQEASLKEVDLKHQTEESKLDILLQGKEKELQIIIDNNERIANEEIILIKEKYSKLGRLTAEQEDKMAREIGTVQFNASNKSLNEQADFYEKNIDLLVQFGADKKKILDAIAKLRAGIQLTDDNLYTITQKEQYELNLEYAAEFASEIGGLFDAISERKLAAIDAEIAAETKKFDYLLKLAESDKAQSESVQMEKDAALAKLEKKRLKEEQKAAKRRKVQALIDIAINTAVAISRAPTDGLIFGLAAIPVLVALGALQAATVLAQPIPQFAEGGRMGYDGKALINDGGNREFIERGGRIFSTPIENAVVDLKRGDIVHKDMNALLNASIMTSLANDNKNLDISKLKVIFDENYSNLENVITKGFNKAKINNNIKLNSFDSNQEYRNSLSRWN